MLSIVITTQKNINLIFEVENTAALEPVVTVITNGLQEDQSVGIEVRCGEVSAYAMIPAPKDLAIIALHLAHMVVLAARRSARPQG